MHSLVSRTKACSSTSEAPDVSNVKRQRGLVQGIFSDKEPKASEPSEVNKSAVGGLGGVCN